MGRPKIYEPDDALAAIKDAFWRAGFEGTSMQDLQAATGLGKQSLYREFGDKRQMYLRALGAYARDEMGAAVRILREEGSAHDRFERLLGSIVDDVERTGDRRGCFLCNASVDQAQLDEESAKRVAAMMEASKRAFADALAGSEPYRSDRALAARTAIELLGAYNGLRVLVKAGQPVDALRQAAGGALKLIG